MVTAATVEPLEFQAEPQLFSQANFREQQDHDSQLWTMSKQV